MSTIILGGGLAGFSLAAGLKDASIILEKEEKPGGLCRSFDFRGTMYDIGPHILFSRDSEALAALASLAETGQRTRSNKIFHEGRFVKYPFENDLAALNEADRAYCLKEFLNNPYENYPAGNMLQFFLRTFGEGITQLYLQPYNEKIWKFSPAFMDTQMVERIPKPPREDVIRSAEGIATEGYKHQLHFSYPLRGGINSLISGLQSRLAGKARVITSAGISSIMKKKAGWEVETAQGRLAGDRLVNCMPLHELFQYLEAPPEIKAALESLRYNSIYIVVFRAAKEGLGGNFAVNFAQRDVIFHRLSKIDFLGENYRSKEGATIMAEITFRPGSFAGGMEQEEIIARTLGDLDRLGLVRRADVSAVEVRQFKYAYVIYDLRHRKNADTVLGFLRDSGIRCCGRFAEFEYLNMDAVMRHSMTLAAELNG